MKSAASARRDLDALFGIEPEVDPGPSSTAAGPEDRER